MKRQRHKVMYTQENSRQSVTPYSTALLDKLTDTLTVTCFPYFTDVFTKTRPPPPSLFPILKETNQVQTIASDLTA